MEIAKLILEYIQVLVWPAVTILSLYVFKNEVKLLLNRLAEIKVGDKTVKFFQDELNKAKILSEEVRTDPELTEEKRKLIAEAPQIPLTDANALMIKHGLRPSPSGLELSYYRDIAKQDPTLALAGLRIELEIIGKNLAKGFGVDIPTGGVTSVFKALAQENAITNNQYNLIQSIVRLANSAIHGTPVTRDDANSVLDTADVLCEQYLSWLSWGFVDKK